MKRSTSATAIALMLIASLMAGCGKSAPTSVSSYSQLSHVATSAPAQTVAQGYAPGTTAATTPTTAAATTQTGTFLLSLSSLQDSAGTIAGLDVELTGPGLAQPLSKQLTPTDMQTSNTLSFENIPAAALTATITAIDKTGAAIGTQNTTIQVKPSTQTKLQLQLSAGPFNFKVVDPSLAATDDPSTGTTTTTGSGLLTSTDATEAPSDGALGVDITNKASVSHYLVFKYLTVTLRVTNHNTSMPLNGQVVVDFHKLKGIFSKTDTVVQTMTAPVTALAPGKTVDITLTSTTSADDAEATVSTVVATATAAGTSDDE